jgi:hypothetical protein
VPPGSAPLWLIAGDCPGHSFAVCEGAIGDIRDVIGECPGFECYIAPKGLDWLLCENHHDFLIAVGGPVRSRLIDVASRNPAEFDSVEPG